MSTPQDTIYKQGDIILLEWGEYDEYNILSVARAEVEFNLNDAIRQYTAQHGITITGATEHSHDPDKNPVVQYLIGLGLITLIEYDTAPLGAYGKVNAGSKWGSLTCVHGRAKETMLTHDQWGLHCPDCNRLMSETRLATWEEYRDFHQKNQPDRSEQVIRGWYDIRVRQQGTKQ